MSNHTNQDLYFKNLMVNRHVGGTFDPLLQSQEQYVKDQRQVLNNNNYNLPPVNRYNFNSNNSNNNINGSNGNYSSGSLYENVMNKLSSSGGCCGGSSLPSLSLYGSSSSGGEIGHETASHKSDVYLRRDQDRYDQYSGFLFNKGLMSDGHQRRRIRSNFLDINSVYRTKKPSEITEPQILLAENPLEFTNDSSTIFINHPNSGFQINDPITLDGVVSKLSILRTIVNNSPTFEIPGGCNVMKIKYKHGVPLNYTGNTIKIRLDNIKGDRGTSETASFLGSVQTNIINDVHDLKITLTQSDILCDINSLLASDPTYLNPSDDYFFITLPVKMQIPSDGSAPYTLTQYNFNLTYESLAGFPLNTLNAKYPIDPDHLSGYHIIKSVNDRGYSIVLPIKASINTGTTSTFLGGGKCVYVARVTSINTGYPDPNKYKISLQDVFHNVIAVRMISSEIPNTEKAVRAQPSERANNKLYWNDVDDGSYLYSIEIPPGNYSPADLAAVIEEQFSKTPRVTGLSADITYTNKHIIQTSINQNTDEVTFSTFKEFIVNSPIFDVIPKPPLSSVQDYDPTTIYKLVINHPKHGMSTGGQTVIISGAIDDLGIPASVINGEHVVTSLGDADGSDPDNKYIITLPRFNLITNRQDTNGGVNVSIFVPDLFSMRFDQPDTLGTVLGFRNAGESIAVTPYNSVISNKDPYQFEQDQNALGQSITITNNSIQLSGENYIIMVANPVKTFRTIGTIKQAFAKIILCDVPGKVLYNTFVPMNYIFDDPIHELYELDIAFYTPDGYLFDFNGVDHSFTLEIITVTDIPEGTGINANTGKNYNQEIQ